MALILSYALPEIPAGSLFSSFDNGHINRSFYLFPFFYLGDLLVHRQVDIPGIVSKKTWLLPSALCFIILSSVNFISERGIEWQLLAPLALCSIPLFIFVALHTNVKLVHFVGVNSIVFYLSHYLAIQVFAKVVKFTSEKMVINDLKFVAAFLCALLLPMSICWFRRKGMFNFLFTLKKTPKNTATLAH